MSVIASAQYIGKSSFQREGQTGSKTYHFLYKADYIEGTGTISFTVFDNDRSVDLSQLVFKSNYRISYYSDRGKGYKHLVDITPSQV